MASNPKASREKVEAFFGSQELFRAYESLKSDRERVNFMYRLPIVQELFQKELYDASQGKARGKSAPDSKRYRELGNQAFKKGKDRKALKLFNEAVVYAPQGGDIKVRLCHRVFYLLCML